MLSFARPSDAVQFALDAVDAMERHWSNDDGALRVRIGVNAGGPVAEDGDLFGSAVTLASRICDAADDGAIWVSEVVRSLTLGKGFSYQPRRSMVFKGFDEPMSVYEAMR